MSSSDAGRHGIPFVLAIRGHTSWCLGIDKGMLGCLKREPACTASRACCLSATHVDAQAQVGHDQLPCLHDVQWGMQMLVGGTGREALV
jgi:hypothetical protein